MDENTRPWYTIDELNAWAEKYQNAQIEFAPVKMVAYNCTCGRTMKFESEYGVISPQRTWVGLTDEEIQECYSEAYKIVQGRQLENAFYKTIEVKLKKKNT